MNHHVIINDQTSDFKILLNSPAALRSRLLSDLLNESMLVVVSESDLQRFALRFKLEKSGKDLGYLILRYLDHRHFQY